MIPSPGYEILRVVLRVSQFTQNCKSATRDSATQLNATFLHCFLGLTLAVTLSEALSWTCALGSLAFTL